MTEEMEALKRVFYRERQARKAAERIAELKTRELAETNLDLEKRIQERTAALFSARDTADRAIEAKMRFLANVSHDLRTPLNGVIGLARMVLETELKDDQKNKLELILSCSESLTTLLNDILDLVKLDSSAMEIKPRVVELRPFLLSLRSVFAAQNEGSAIEIRTVFEKELLSHYVFDDSRVRQVLFNLLSNAFKFTKRGYVEARVKAVSCEERSFLEFQVEDSGCGIPQELISTIFDPFVQADNQNENRQGVGLGLAISRKLVQAMGGKICIESEIGRGTCVTFSVGSSQAEKPADKNESKLSELPRLRILLVEDNELNRMVAEGLLKRWKQDVHSVTDGFKAIEARFAEDWDLILMDIAMPRMSGLEAVREIRLREKEHRVPIYALTAHAVVEGDKEYFDAGFDGTLAKPICLDDLSGTLRCVVNQREERG